MGEMFYIPVWFGSIGERLSSADYRDDSRNRVNAADSSGVSAVNRDMPSKPEPSIAAIMMAGIGGLLAFFGLSFGLVAAVAEPGFLIVCLVTCAISISLFVMAYAARRRQIGKWERAEEIAVASAKCDYCGSQNPVGQPLCARTQLFVHEGSYSTAMVLGQFQGDCACEGWIAVENVANRFRRYQENLRRCKRAG